MVEAEGIFNFNIYQVKKNAEIKQLLIHLAIITPSSLSHAEIVCQACPVESVVTQITLSKVGFSLGKTPNLNFLDSSKNVIPLPCFHLVIGSIRSEPSIV